MSLKLIENKPLTADEQDLLNFFRRMNSHQRFMVLTFLECILAANLHPSP